jgi:hypothetical protein
MSYWGNRVRELAIRTGKKVWGSLATMAEIPGRKNFPFTPYW